MNLDGKTAKAVLRLSNDPDFRILMEALEKIMKEKAVRSCYIIDEPQRTWMQGWVQALKDIIDLPVSAEKTVK